MSTLRSLRDPIDFLLLVLSPSRGNPVDPYLCLQQRRYLMSKFDFHYDAGHGWLKVHIYDAADVGLYADDFSAYSYRNGEHLYLEEDCDAGRFLAAWDKALRKFDVRHIDDGYNSPIRSYEHIIPLGRLADELSDEIPF
jgi:hypothetical protein